MIPKRSFLRAQIAGFTTLFVTLGLSAAPLTWFPGPPIDPPTSGAAIVTVGASNVVVGGTSSYYYYYGGYAQALGATNAYWNYVATIPDIRIAAGAVISDGALLIFGGTNITSSAEQISLSGDSLPPVASMNAARAYLGYAADSSGNAYAIGGLDDSGNVLASVERYNLGRNSWTNIASLPTPLFDFPAVFDKTNRIYVFGGYTDAISGVESAAVYRYSTSTRTWTNLASMPIATAGSAAAYGADGKIYVVGGLSGGIATDAVQVYNPAANTWALAPSLPKALSSAVMGSDALGRLVVIGGTDINGNDLGDVWRSQQLGIPDSLPVFTQYPTTNATYTNIYDSFIAATGNPQPTYALVTGPVGMTLDASTGEIIWTPQANQIGANAITLRATNYAGYVDYSYSITVPYPPPAAVSNLAVLSATETSVTISWNPEPALVGPVTYSVWLRHVAHSPRGSGVTIWYTELASGITATTVTIGGLTPGFSQAYYIVATGPGGSSGTNVSINATTLSLQPPANVRITGKTSTTITFAWDPPPGPIAAVSYEIWGWDNFGISSASSSYASNILNTTFTLTGLAPGSSHNWAVRAHDALGYNSQFSFFGGGYLVPQPVPAPATLSSSGLTPDGNFQITASEGGSVLQTVLIQATTNPADSNSWVQIGALLPSANPFTFTDTNASQFPSRFYRVIAP